MSLTIERYTLAHRFIGFRQFAAIREAMLGEERADFIEKLDKLTQLFETMPKTLEQDALGRNAVAHLHYFAKDCHWYITERDSNLAQEQAFGLCFLGDADMAELGYVSIREITQLGAEIDLYWTPKTIREIEREIRA